MISTKFVIRKFVKNYENCHCILQQNQDDVRFLQKALKLLNFELLRLHHLKFQTPKAWELSYQFYFIFTCIRVHIRMSKFCLYSGRAPRRTQFQSASFEEQLSKFFGSFVEPQQIYQSCKKIFIADREVFETFQIKNTLGCTN